MLVLRRIMALKAEGSSLEEIRQQLNPSTSAPAWPRPQTWQVLQPTDDVAVFVRGDVPPWRRNQIDKALNAIKTGSKLPKGSLVPLFTGDHGTVLLALRTGL